MRLTVLLPLYIAVATPAFAQPQAQPVAGISGIHFNNGSAIPGSTDSYGSPSLSRAPMRDGHVERARRLIAAGHYAEADALLTRLMSDTSSKQLRFLKGVTKLGLGDAAAARRYFERSLYSGRNGYPGAMSGLALAEIRLGNRDAAEAILDKLRYQQEKCRSDCDRAKPLEQAISVVEKALI